MNRKIIMAAAVAALVSAAALDLRAEEGPGEEEEIEMMDDGPGRPGPGGPGRGMGKGEKRMMWTEKGEGEPGDERMMVKIRKMREMRGGKGPGGPGFMSEEDTLAIIRKHDPAFAKKVEELGQMAPAKYKMVLQMSGKLFGVAKMEQDESIEKDAVRALALEFESKELSIKYDKAQEADRKAIKDTLRGKLAELFDLKTKGQELRVKHMEKEMAKLRKNLDSRKANKAKIVEQRLEQMTGEGYGW